MIPSLVIGVFECVEILTPYLRKSIVLKGVFRLSLLTVTLDCVSINITTNKLHVVYLGDDKVSHQTKVKVHDDKPHCDQSRISN